ncbi:hypothetical protein J4732_15295 [Serratia marcescens]|uniref:Uncharacterized protein n=1 Tax=Serratia marcescens TaxID=615 RepID=A0A939NQM8_SERMA|nr:hypothetical protein [Serratia marcescens]
MARGIPALLEAKGFDQAADMAAKVALSPDRRRCHCSNSQRHRAGANYSRRGFAGS